MGAAWKDPLDNWIIIKSIFLVFWCLDTIFIVARDVSAVESGCIFKVSVNPRLERHAVTRFSEVCEVYFTA